VIAELDDCGLQTQATHAQLCMDLVHEWLAQNFPKRR
jgi:hypothetical protein